MLAFAKQTGFEGSDADWEEEFQSLCQELGINGVDLTTFGQLVDDRSERGCYCTKEDLQSIIRSRSPPETHATNGAITAPKSVLLRQQYRMHPSMTACLKHGFVASRVDTFQTTVAVTLHQLSVFQ
eukprot:g33210.t1